MRVDPGAPRYDWSVNYCLVTAQFWNVHSIGAGLWNDLYIKPHVHMCKSLYLILHFSLQLSLRLLGLIFLDIILG